jgi:hypothetical protein
MNATHLLVTALLAGTLVVPLALAGPRAKAPQPAPMLTEQEQLCRAFGMFVYKRAIDRDRGASLTDQLIASRQFDQANNAIKDVWDIHYALLRKIYTPPYITPTEERQAFETGCLSVMPESQTPQPPGTPSYNPRLRY